MREPRFLDSVRQIYSSVGYGELGLNGWLGYEGKKVVVAGRHYKHSISAHAPSRVIFGLSEVGYESLITSAVFNDDLSRKDTSATFEVYINGRLAAAKADLRPGEEAVQLVVDLRGASFLELSVRGKRRNGHTLWLEPRLILADDSQRADGLTDCLGTVQLLNTLPKLQTDVCIVTSATQGDEKPLARLLKSLQANINWSDTMVAVFIIDGNPELEEIVTIHGARPIPCRFLSTYGRSIQSVLYSAAKFIQAKRFICLDRRSVVVGDIRPLVASIAVVPQDAILVGRKSNLPYYRTLADILEAVCQENPTDCIRYFGATSESLAYPFVASDQVIASSCYALFALDGRIRSMSNARTWINQSPECASRVQLLFNVALALGHCAVEISPHFNLQSGTPPQNDLGAENRLPMMWHKEPVRIVSHSEPFTIAPDGNHLKGESGAWTPLPLAKLSSLEIDRRLSICKGGCEEWNESREQCRAASHYDNATLRERLCGEPDTLCPLGKWGALRLAFLTPSLLMGGAERWIASLCRHFDTRFVQPIAIAVTEYDNRSPIVEGWLPAYVQVVSSNRLAAVMRDANVLISWGNSDLPRIWSTAKQSQCCHLVDVQHGTMGFGRFQQILASAAIAAGAHLTAVGAACLENFPHEFRSSITVIENGAEEDRLVPSAGRAATRARFGIGNDEKLVLFIGRFTEVKNLAGLAAAIGLLPPHWKLMAVGPPYQPQPALLALKERAIILPPQEHLGDLFAAADIFCAPSHHEAGSIAVIEAWIAGIPVVTTDYPAIREVLAKHGDISVIIPVNPAPRQLANVIIETELGGRASPRVQHAKAVAMQHYTAKAMVRRWEDYLLDQFAPLQKRACHACR